MAHIPHALSLPEVAFRVVRYLELDDLVACSLVGKSFYASYAPYLWENVHLGTFSPSEKRAKRNQEPLARLVTLEMMPKDNLQPELPPSPQEGVLQFLQRKAPWIRSLSLHAAYFGRQMMLNDQFTNIRSLLVSPPASMTQYDETQWNACEALVLQNSTWLRSLTLSDWGERFGDPRRLLWRPLHTCAQHANLSTLRMQFGKLYEQDLEAFWTICRQLETLELTVMGMQVLFDKTYRTRRLRNNQTDNALTHGTTPLIDGPVPAPTTTIPTSPTTTPTPPTPIRFPKLRELKLAMIDLAPDHQMEQIIVQCPMLHTLVLRLKEYRFSMRDFCNFLEEGTWPYLDSLEITGQYNVISTQEHTLLLESTRRPFKRLDLYLGSVEQGPFDLLREGGHFDTLTKIDLSIPPLARSHLKSMVNGVDVAASKRIREVLESCPSLEHFSATAISGRDIIGSKPWVCHRLQKFEVLICMELTKQYTTRVVYTKDEKIRCHQVFERLSQLRHLKVLNMSNPYLERFLAVTPVTLPLELRMGLGRLSTLRDLESIGYQGSQRMRVVDVEWMLKHWSKLRTISGGRPSTKYSKTFGNRNVECYLLVTALKARKVEVPVEWGACEKDVKEYMTKNRLEIVYDTDNDSEEVNDSEMDEIGRAIAVGMRL